MSRNWTDFRVSQPKQPIASRNFARRSRASGTFRIVPFLSVTVVCGPEVYEAMELRRTRQLRCSRRKIDGSKRSSRKVSE